ncbi:MAG: flavoprotein, partial [Vicinamibacterales bacterium]
MCADRRPTSVTVAITGASGALYATRTLAALLERELHVELVISDYGRRLLRDELGDEAAVETLLP